MSGTIHTKSKLPARHCSLGPPRGTRPGRARASGNSTGSCIRGRRARTGREDRIGPLPPAGSQTATSRPAILVSRSGGSAAATRSTAAVARVAPNIIAPKAERTREIQDTGYPPTLARFLSKVHLQPDRGGGGPHRGGRPRERAICPRSRLLAGGAPAAWLSRARGGGRPPARRSRSPRRAARGRRQS